MNKLIASAISILLLGAYSDQMLAQPSEQKRRAPLVIMAWHSSNRTEKQTHYFLNLAVKNVSGSDVFVHPSLQNVDPAHRLFPMKVRVYSLSGKGEMRYEGPIVRPALLRDSDLIRLAPGCFYGTTVDMLACYKLTRGRYRIEITYDTVLPIGE